MVGSSVNLQIKFLLYSMTVLITVLSSNIVCAQDPNDRITIEGENRSPPRISFEYSFESDVKIKKYFTTDLPGKVRPSQFEGPNLTKDEQRAPHPTIARSNNTIVEDYSWVELLGIGAGIMGTGLLLVL